MVNGRVRYSRTDVAPERRRVTVGCSLRRVIPVLARGFLLLGAIGLTGCEFMLSNTVPDFMPYVIDEIDLSSAIPRTAREIRLELIPGGPDGDNPVYVLMVRPDAAGRDVAVFLEGSGPSVRAVQKSTDITRYDTRAFRRIDGGVQVGNLVYDPVNSSLSNGPRLSGEYGPMMTIRLGDPPVYQVIRRVESEYMEWELFDSEFLSLGTADENDPFGDFGIVTTADLRELEIKWNLGWVHDFFLHGYDDINDRDETWVFSVDQDSADPPMQAVKLASGSVRYRMLQRTPRGIFSQSYDGRLTRFDPDTGAVLDRFTPYDRDWDRDLPIVFDPSGSFYLLLDQDKRILYKVAPWW